MLGSAALAVLIAALIPPFWIGLSGGADVDVLGQRIDFYRTGAPAVAILGCVALGALPGAAGAARIFRSLAIALFALVALLCWGAGVETEWIRVRSPGPSVAIGAVLVGLAWVRARGSHSLRHGARTTAAGLLLGAAATASVVAADRADLARQIAAAEPHAESPDVIFLLLDTLRADALGTYGASPSPSPFLDGLAERGVVFEHALSQAPWTAPSVASLMTSLYPSSFLRERVRISGDRYFLLPTGLPWLPSLLQEAGYHTAGFVKNPLLQRGAGFDLGFDVHEWVRGHTAEHESAAELVDAVLRWGDVMAERRARQDPGSFFLYVHFMDPHVQYRAPAPFLAEDEGYEGVSDGGVKSIKKLLEQPGGPRPADLARLRALYRGEVAYLDTQLARLHEGLAAEGIWTAETFVFVIADHGEQFYEHGGFMHGDVHWENLHVPFLVSGPGVSPARVPEPVAMLDIPPTLLALLELDAPKTMEGRSLAPRLFGEPLAPAVVVSEVAKQKREDLRLTGHGWSLLTGVAEERVDPIEGRVPDSVEARAEAEAALRRAHRRYLARPRPFAHVETRTLEPDADTERRLRALGYVE